MQTYTKMRSRKFPEVIMKVIPGHFVTPNSHINYYIDMTTMKTRQNEAMAAAKAMASTYSNNTTIVDTIVCMDGMEVIGAYLAQELTNAGVMTTNTHKTIYIYSPEFDKYGQMIFRESSDMMIQGKHVLILLASATTGQTILRAAKAINYYGGTLTGITAIFAAPTKIMGHTIHSLYKIKDLPDYRSYSSTDCALCKNHVPIDAICNSFGYSKLT